ncbi:MAG: cell division protein FtsA [Draconibacterium sp.]|nr:MAG: cell division protein FtsA [Draconibacterium sp.]
MTIKNDLSVVVDIGTSKITGVAGFKNDTNRIVISALAKGPSKGIRRGIIYNIDEAATAIKNVLADLERQTDASFDKVHVAIAAQNMQSENFKNTKITADQGIVTRFDIDHLYNEAWKAEVAEDQKIIDVVPVSYVIDGEPVEINPVGIAGRKIEANYKLLVLPETILLNLQRVLDKAGYQLGELKHAALAVSESVLTEEEKEMGAIALDMGAGTTKMAVFYENQLVHTAVVPFGGEVVTRDIKEGCSIVLKWAELLKIQYGGALGDFADDQKVVTIPGFNGWEPKEISFKSLAFIIQARLEEILDCVNYELGKSGLEAQLGAGIVLTGGTTNLPNFISLVKFRTGMDTRQATLALKVSEASKAMAHPDFYTAIGLLNKVVNKPGAAICEKSKKVKRKKEGGGFSPLFQKVVQGVLNYIDDDNEDIPMN